VCCCCCACAVACAVAPAHPCSRHGGWLAERNSHGHELMTHILFTHGGANTVADAPLPPSPFPFLTSPSLAHRTTAPIRRQQQQQPPAIMCALTTDRSKTIERCTTRPSVAIFGCSLASAVLSCSVTIGLPPSPWVPAAPLLRYQRSVVQTSAPTAAAAAEEDE
jgi:hypothetical protein